MSSLSVDDISAKRKEIKAIVRSLSLPRDLSLSLTMAPPSVRPSLPKRKVMCKGKMSCQQDSTKQKTRQKTRHTPKDYLGFYNKSQDQKRPDKNRVGRIHWNGPSLSDSVFLPLNM